jgi:hypothetical protein
MGFGDSEVIGDGRDGCDDIVEKRLARRSALALDQLDAHHQLGHRNRCDRDVVVIGDDVIEVNRVAFGIDEEGRVQQQKAQRRSSTSSSRRNAASSLAQLGSNL